ncbi:MAG TPA: helix-turn-helix domain-containing protein [Pirellulales bacterium]|nr:helix-turn-helix domain-containing protein [Pirellulales bacterium]
MIEQTYQRFVKLTGDATAAALLTLAAAISSNKPEAAPEQLSVTQAAKRLGLPRRTVNDLCNSGKLQHHRHGKGRGTIRIAPADLDAYLADAQVEPMKLKYF